MDVNFFLKGMVLGFVTAVPVGPVAVLCIRRTLEFGRWSGFFSGLGAAIGDTIFGIIAAFSITLISDFLIAEQFWIRVAGGVFLMYLGVKGFFSKPAPKSKQISHSTLLGDFTSAFFLTILSPMTIFGYLAIFAAFGLSVVDKHYENAALLVLGIFIGSAFWWLILSEGLTFFRHRVTRSVMGWINCFAGLIMMGFGILVWFSILWE